MNETGESEYLIDATIVKVTRASVIQPSSSSDSPGIENMKLTIDDHQTETRASPHHPRAEAELEIPKQPVGSNGLPFFN